MPTYDLRCSACDAAFELFFLRTIRDADKVCPECGSSDVKQKLSGGFFSRPSASDASGPPCGSSSCSSEAGGSFG